MRWRLALKLTDLKPKWLRRDGKAVAMIFLCPRCVARKTGCERKRLTWLTCMFVVVGNREQRELIEAIINNDPADFLATDTEEHDVVGCKEIAWGKNCKNFESMSITPSLDASAAGHWHGHVTGGKIVGGI